MHCPAQTTMSCRAEVSIHGWTYLASAVMGSEGSLGSEGPASLTAMIRNSYSVPSVRPDTLPTGLGPGVSHATSQIPNLVFFSMIHLVIVEPPSFLGGSHSKSIVSGLQLVAKGLPEKNIDNAVVHFAGPLFFPSV